jgi:hypothetical protein
MGWNVEIIREVYSDYRPQELGILWEALAA